MIFTPIDAFALNIVLRADGIDVPLLSSGFAILPDGLQAQSQTLNPIDGATPNEVHSQIGGRNTNGSLLTVAFQIPMPTAPSNALPLASAATVNGLFAPTVRKIKAAFSRANGAQ
jgi:hypothetical protein